MLRTALFFVIAFIVALASGEQGSSSFTISGVLTMDGSMPSGTMVDVMLYDKDGVIVKGASASGALGYFDMFDIPAVEEGWTVKVSVNDRERIDAERSVFSVGVGPTGGKHIIAEGLKLAFKGVPCEEVTTVVPTLLTALTDSSVSDFPLLYKRASTGNLVSFVITVMAIIGLGLACNKMFGH